jgi:hypothetical protein
MAMKHGLSGEITRMPFRKLMTVAVEGLLNDVGKVGVSRMKEHTGNIKSSGRLDDSVMYVTARGGSRMGASAKSTDAIPKPTTVDTVIVGSNTPYAQYIEGGSGPHSNPEGHEQFVDDLKDWYQRTFGVHPDTDAKTRFHFWNIYDKIVAEGTDKQPFVLPVRDGLYDYANKQMRKAITTMFRSASR